MSLKQNREEIEKRLTEIEKEMSGVHFWDDKDKAQKVIEEYNDLKSALEGVGKYDKGDAVMTIFAGAGGLDAEDFASMLLRMYLKFFERKGFVFKTLHENKNDHGGFRNIVMEVVGKGLPAATGTAQAGAYGTLKNESGVHRLVRISPFNAKSQRHTSFAMVEVVPKLSKGKEIEVKDEDVDVEFARSSGPGGQNVNKRETAVRVVHKETGISAHVDSERTQQANREKALEILAGKLYHMRESEREKEKEGFAVSKTTQAEWGSQIRSYVLHPYQMIKDHRTDVEIRNIDSVLEDGELDELVEAEKEL